MFPEKDVAANYPRLVEWRERVTARPAVAEALKGEDRTRRGCARGAATARTKRDVNGEKIRQCAHGCCRQARTGSTSSRWRSCPIPTPGPGEVLIQVHACSINYRDFAVAAGKYFGGALKAPAMPLSDGAGEVVAVGAGRQALQGRRPRAERVLPGVGGRPAAHGPGARRRLRARHARRAGRAARGRRGADGGEPRLRPGRVPALRRGHRVERALRRAARAGARHARCWCSAAAGCRCSRCSSPAPAGAR